jgi:hypothetical protein
MHTAPHVRFHVLGPLEIWEDERRIKPGGPVNERVLAMLLLEAGRVVPVSRLAQAVWDEEPPSTAVHQGRPVSRPGSLRLRPAGRRRGDTTGPAPSGGTAVVRPGVA